MSTALRSSLPHLLSLARPLAGVAILFTMPPGGDSALLLVLVLAACASDWLDGEVARRLQAGSTAGRLVDNLCDFFFLLLLFEYFALGRIWSPPGRGLLLQWIDFANQLPVLALLASFGSYFVRLLRDLAAGLEPARSPRGHAAGVCNYILAVVGAAGQFPGLPVAGRLLEPAMLAVVLLNLSAVPENLRLMFHRDGAGPRMPA